MKLLFPIRFSRAVLFSLLTTILSTPAYCRRGQQSQIPVVQEETTGPWFTGTLLTPSGNIVPVGYMYLEPYFAVSDSFATYDQNWQTHSTPAFVAVNPLVFFQIGLTEWMDFQTFPQAFYQHSQGREATHFGDLPTGLNFQLLKATPEGWWPSIKLSIREIFPTGKYQHLDPHKNGTDITGGGSYDTGLGLSFSRLFHLGGIYYLNTRLSLNYDTYSTVHVEGFNTYGGGFGTKGNVRPGPTYTGLMGLEFTLAKHWVFAIDLANFYGNKTTFRGYRGVTSRGAQAKVGFPSYYEFDLAPAIEYNFNESVGIIGGVWFSVAGRNTIQFASSVIAFSWYTSIRGKKKPSTQPGGVGGSGSRGAKSGGGF